MESPCSSRLWAGDAACGEELPAVGDPCWSSLFLKDGPCVQNHIGAVLGELLPMGSPCRISCSLGRGGRMEWLGRISGYFYFILLCRRDQKVR